MKIELKVLNNNDSFKVEKEINSNKTVELLKEFQDLCEKYHNQITVDVDEEYWNDVFNK